MMSISPAHLAFLPQSYFQSPATVQGAPLPLNPNHLMPLGLVNIPPISSSFGSSLESLARAAKEHTRQFSNFSPAHFPEALSPSHIPTGKSSGEMFVSAPPSTISITKT